MVICQLMEGVILGGLELSLRGVPNKGIAQLAFANAEAHQKFNISFFLRQSGNIPINSLRWKQPS